MVGWLLLAAGTVLAHPQQATLGRDEIAIPGERVQGYLAGEFPRDFTLLGGLLVVNTRDPQLQIPRQGERVQLRLHASAGLAGAAVQPLGWVELSSQLRYAPTDRALFLDQPRLERFVPDDPGHPLDPQLREALNLWLQDYARTQPVYVLDPQLLAPLGAVRVQAVRVAQGAVVIRFDQPVGMPDLEDTP